jgi:hypothetical protein
MRRLTVFLAARFPSVNQASAFLQIPRLPPAIGGKLEYKPQPLSLAVASERQTVIDLGLAKYAGQRPPTFVVGAMFLFCGMCALPSRYPWRGFRLERHGR